MTIELAYLGVEVSDLPGLAAVVEGVAGLVRSDSGGPGSTWRNDDRVLRVFADEGPADDATVVGFEVADTVAADGIVTRLRDQGYDVEPGTPDERSQRCVEELWRASAPWGVRVEIVHGLAKTDEPFVSALVPGGFKTSGMGFGHCVFMVPDLEDAHRFVVDGLGFRQTDWLDLVVGPGVAVEGRFYHGNPRHHTLALICPPGPPSPKKLHHFMVETHSADDVGAAFDRAFEAGHPIPNGLGKHDNDKMFSFYTLTPAGFQIEVGHGAREVGDDWAENRAYDSISMWGHQPVNTTEPANSTDREGVPT